MPEHKISSAPRNRSFASSFKHVKLWTECKEDYMGVGESKAGMDDRIVNKIKCSPEDGCGFRRRGLKRGIFKGVVTEMHGNQWTGLV